MLKTLTGFVLIAGVVAAIVPAAQQESLTSSDWLGLLPDGEMKQRFILDCTGCHQFDERITRPNGQPRAEAQFVEAIGRMLSFAGATTGFPVIAHDRDAAATAKWLAPLIASTPRRRPPAEVQTITGAVTEFDLPEPQDLPHDVAVDSDGRVVVTGMFTHQMYVLDPATRRVETVPIPVDHANPRAVEIDSAGNWWVALGSPQSVARYIPAIKQWRAFSIGFYPHSVAIGGGVWANGHFTRAPEVIARVDAGTGRVDSMRVTPHASLANAPGGPIPYEIRVGPDGRVWGSELQGNRLFAYSPRSGTMQMFEMPTPNSGPRRFDLDASGSVWIPAYATNELVKLDPATGRFTRYRLPVADAVPYVVRVDQSNGRVWIGTGASDDVLSFDPQSTTFTRYPLPSRGAMVRHLSIDPRTHDVWVAYGASPGRVPARVARIRASGGKP
jgi:virginiamycin B lyase